MAALFALAGIHPGAISANTEDSYHSLRTCLNRDYIQSVSADDDHTSATKPVRKQRYTNVPAANVEYSESMERLIRSEIQNIHSTVETVAEKFAALQDVTGSRKSLHTITLEDVAGAWRDGQFVRAEKSIHLHFNEQGKVSCMVLEAINVPINLPSHWTRKYLRMYMPHTNIVEMETLRKNYRLYNTLNNASILHRLEGLRTMHSHIRTALYKIDLQIAAHYDQSKTVADWQIEM